MSLRTTLLAVAFAASCAATPPAPAPVSPPSPSPPVPQAANDSEALYRKMESALAKAKKLQVEFQSSSDNTAIKGTFKVGEGNKFEMNIAGAAGQKKYTLVLTCDGTKMNLTRTETPPPPIPLQAQPELPAPGTLATNVLAALARGGAWLAQDFSEGEYRAVANPYFEERQKAAEEEHRPMKPLPPVAPRDVTALHELRNFRPGGAGAVTYDLVRKGDNPMLVATLTVTIDPKSNLPTRREGAFFLTGSEGKPGEAPLSKWSETYSFK